MQMKLTPEQLSSLLAEWNDGAAASDLVAKYKLPSAAVLYNLLHKWRKEAATHGLVVKFGRDRILTAGIESKEKQKQDTNTVLGLFARKVGAEKSAQT